MMITVFVYLKSSRKQTQWLYTGMFSSEPSESLCMIQVVRRHGNHLAVHLPLQRGRAGGVRSEGVRGQRLPHTCWERCTTISPSPSGNFGRPRSSEPPHSRLPPPEREREEMHEGGAVHRGSKKAARFTSETQWIITAEWEPDTSRYKHISHPNIAWNVATRSTYCHNNRVRLAITLPNVINKHVVLLIEKETKGFVVFF